MKNRILLIVTLILITACTPALEPALPPSELPPDAAVTSPPTDTSTTQEPMPDPLLPQPGDSKLTRGNVFIEEAGLVIRESYPPQISLNLSGELPTPCHQLRAKVNEPDVNNKINVDVYTVVDPDLMCTQVLKPFSESVDLGTFPSGHYSVWVNGESVGEFDS
jgi:hypothetical protein